MSDFLAMGGYAAYIWPAYGLTAAVLLGLLVATVKGLRSVEATARALEATRPARRRERAPRGAAIASEATASNKAAGTPAGVSEG
ncbi:heme exporter protein CcmD [Azospirillum thermophilum]|uniref:Heme exporter protein D n=1 Tax=Azospirillum thermophilum TaxID=2202148 RepID=A0A2S2CTH7_9PROT|nr:heme exporter protein CcmD [Azospirillum thermophilum]AWK87778.1 heme exporter protein CcmD [Azospirillum thermophilum]